MREIRIRCLAAAMMATLFSLAGAAQTDTTNTTETRVETRAIPFKVTYEFSRTVTSGRLLTSSQGKPGQLVNTYTVTVKDGKPVSKVLVSTKKIEPVDEVILMGKPAYETSRHKFTRGRVMVMSASAYDPSPRTIPGTTGRCANGMRAGYGVVAVDPRVIPLGSTLYVEGYGFAIAADTGGAIKGNRIDLCYDWRSTALQFGRRKVKVHILHGA
jgi:3D (Asp-Asp-Asp) domain-containing protein